MSESEPSMTYRKGYKVLSKPESPVAPGQAYEKPAYCVSGSRYIGGMSSTQALAWNVGTCTLMERENIKQKDSARVNTDAMCRGGAARISVEAPVKGVERRGSVIQLVSFGQPEMG